ncbi:MAG: PIN domain-containing protein [Candidatus Aenigmatarchaeota archaeon]
MFSMHKFIEIESLYLDSNIVIRYFKNFIKKKKTPFILDALSLNPRFKLFISSWTFAEVFETMQKEFNLSQEETLKIYKNFLKEFKVELIEEFQVDSFATELVRDFGLESKDALHLLISKRKNLSLLTTDKKLIERGILKYKKIVTPEEIILEYSDFLKL